MENLTFHEINAKPHISLHNVQSWNMWKRPHTKAIYPVRWEITIPKASLNLNIEAKIEDSEFDTRKTSRVIYWEGPVKVTGSEKGEGYVEMTEYAHPMGRL